MRTLVAVLVGAAAFIYGIYGAVTGRSFIEHLTLLPGARVQIIDGVRAGDENEMVGTIRNVNPANNGTVLVAVEWETIRPGQIETVKSNILTSEITWWDNRFSTIAWIGGIVCLCGIVIDFLSGDDQTPLRLVLGGMGKTLGCAGTVFVKVVGVTLLIGGVCVSVLSMNMDTTVDSGTEYGRVVNLHKSQVQRNRMIMGGIVAVVGLGILGVTRE